METRYSIIEFSALVNRKGFEVALEEYSRATGKDKEVIKGLYLSAVDQVQEEGY